MTTPLSRPRILIVDDDVGAIHLLGEILSGIGDLFFATNGGHAIRVAAEKRPDVILLDAEMPGMDGYEVCAALKAVPQTAQTAIIFVTAHADIEHEAKALEAGAVDFITKPISPPILCARVRTHLVLKAQADELRRSNADLEQFAYVASHDLRQPLRAISGFLTRLKTKLDPDLDEEGQLFLNFALEGAKRMDNLILGLLEYSRAVRDMAFEPVNLRETLQDALQNLALDIGDAGAAVRIFPGFPVVMGDRMELMRLFQNLLGNALKYRAPDRKPHIEITARQEGKEWVIAIQDNGIGIAPQHQDRIFGLFQRAVGQETYAGTGIGLSVCRKICDHHGGRIWVESEVGQGARFVVVLPAGDGV